MWTENVSFTVQAAFWHVQAGHQKHTQGRIKAWWIIYTKGSLKHESTYHNVWNLSPLQTTSVFIASLAVKLRPHLHDNVFGWKPMLQFDCLSLRGARKQNDTKTGVKAWKCKVWHFVCKINTFLKVDQVIIQTDWNHSKSASCLPELLRHPSWQ